MSSPFGDKPYGEKKTVVAHGRRMAYVEQGTGIPIVFQHGNPTSSYLWRNITPHLEGLGRIIACDLIGMRELSAEEMAAYVRPFANPGEDGRPTLTFPRQIPINGHPANVVKIVDDYGRWLARSDIPKLFINAEPGGLLTGRPRDFCRTWPNQTEVTVAGKHFVQEDSPDQIGQAVRALVQGLRQSHIG
jgi:pimeloyl-ACP methyl ester carboxylesterase